MKFNMIAVGIFLALSLVSVVYGQTDVFVSRGTQVVNSQANVDEIADLINNYRDALATRDKDTIKSAWIRLHQNSEAVEYMKQNLPDMYQSYLFRRAGISFDELQDQQRVVNLRTTLEAPQQLELSTPQAVEAKVRPLTNREVVLGLPNQDRPSNQEVIRSRLESLERNTGQGITPNKVVYPNKVRDGKLVR